MAELAINPEMSVGAIVAEYPATMRLFEALGIDYCCGGKMPLAEAARGVNMPVERVIAVLQAAMLQAPAGERNWQTAPLDELMEHIVQQHHTFMRRELPRIAEMLAKVRRAHGERHGDVLEPLAETFNALRLELEQHLEKEETVTFPAIRMVLTGQADERARQTIVELEHEHEVAGEALARMRTLTNDYHTPADACATYCGLYNALQDMERDLHEHIHLENNVLFPRTREVLASQGRAA